MARMAYDSWKREINDFNNVLPFYVKCDCGELAEFVYGKINLFECSTCNRLYRLSQGEYELVEENRR